MGTALVLVALFGAFGEAEASRCGGYIKKAEYAKDAALIDAYRRLKICDVEVAKENFDRFARASNNSSTFTEITLMGIDAGVTDAVWEAFSDKSYDVQSPIVERVGAECGEGNVYESFLQASYVKLRGPEFLSWEPALRACESDSMGQWLQTQVMSPPASRYNDKYNVILSAYAERVGDKGLDSLREAAIVAGNTGGPMASVLDTMAKTIEPSGMGAIDPAKQEALNAAYVQVGRAVEPAAARMVMDRLQNGGNEELAASLLPAVYADRVQSNGSMLWGVAALEQCDGMGVLHWSTYAEAPKRLDVSETVTPALQGAKAKLKCESEERVILVSPEPVADKSAAEAWAEEMAAQWSQNGLEIKLKAEKLKY